MIIFPDSASHVLDHPTPVVPLELGGKLDRGLGLEARYRWPGFETEYKRALASGDLSAKSPHVIPWPTGNDQIALLAPAADGRSDDTARGLLASTRIIISSLMSIGPAAAAAGRRSVGVPPFGYGPKGVHASTLVTWLADAVTETPDIDWHIYWWPRAEFDAPEIKSVLGHLMDQTK